jgi:hypothetical protein
MHRMESLMLAVMVSLALGPSVRPPDAAAQAMKLRVVSDHTATGFAFPESVGCDAQDKVLYASQFGSELKPLEKDGKGKISKVAMDGKILEEHFLPRAGQVLNKPKGVWIEGNRLWVTDIDVVWVFDLKTREGRKVDLPGAKFANDPAVKGNALYVSDNRGDQLFRVEPADFLDAKSDPKVTVVMSGKSVNPNGVYPARDGSILMAGFLSDKEARGIYALSRSGEVTPLARDVGRLDGLWQLEDDSLLVTNWNTGSLFHWSATGGGQDLASGFKGPADFCVVPESGGLLVVVPDLVKSELRFIRLAK